MKIDARVLSVANPLLNIKQFSSLLFFIFQIQIIHTTNCLSPFDAQKLGIRFKINSLNIS